MRIAIDHSEHSHKNIDIEVHTKHTIAKIILYFLCIVEILDITVKKGNYLTSNPLYINVQSFIFIIITDTKKSFVLTIG